MGSLLRSVPQKVSPFGPFLHGLGEGAAEGAGVAAGTDGSQRLHLDPTGSRRAYAEGVRGPPQAAPLGRGAFTSAWRARALLMPGASETSRRVRVWLPSRPWRIWMTFASRSGKDRTASTSAISHCPTSTRA